MNWAAARAMTARKRPTPATSRRGVEEMLDAAREAETRALVRFERKNAAVQKYENLKRRRERKLDTRRKIIAGAIALEHMKYDPAFAARFQELLDRYVRKSPERLLFGLALPPHPAPDSKTMQKASANTP
ncbi:MAG TPA: hypothetical protein VMF32_08830 [Xanthobacteraceae bacterium]|nr:hypothetical protein [Xanthobacteraceae bacterium]